MQSPVIHELSPGGMLCFEASCFYISSLTITEITVFWLTNHTFSFNIHSNLFSFQLCIEETTSS